MADINALFGHDIAELVRWLTDTSKPEDGNRAVRKGIDRDRLAQAPAEAQFIKLADMIDNSVTIQIFDKPFAKLFMAEMKQLVDYMHKVAGSSLWIDANDVVTRYYERPQWD